jgi:hypothetical protein
MSIRTKLFIIFFACGIAPLLILGIYNYWTSARTIEALLRDDIEQDSHGITEDLQACLSERESGMIELAKTRSLREYASNPHAPHTSQATMSSSNEVHPGATTRAATTTTALQPSTSVIDAALDSSAASSVPESVRAQLAVFLESNRKYYDAITCLDEKGGPLLRLEEISNSMGGYQLHFQTENFIPGSFSPDESVWSVDALKPLRAKATRGPHGTLVRYTIPLFNAEEGGNAPRGALLLDLKLESIFNEATSGRVARWSSNSLPKDAALAPRFIIALSRDEQIVYHTN